MLDDADQVAWVNGWPVGREQRRRRREQRGVESGRVEPDGAGDIEGHVDAGGAGEVVSSSALVQYDVARRAGGAGGADGIAGLAARLELVIALGPVGARAAQEQHCASVDVGPL